MSATTSIEIKRLQEGLQSLGLYDGEVDGQWFDLTESAWAGILELANVRLEATIPDAVPPVSYRLAWGAKVSALFCDRVQWIANELRMPTGGASDLMACMAWESGETFSPSVKNMAGSGATGLIQFMPKTAIALGTTVEALARMTPEDQLNYVYKYFLPYRGRLAGLGDVYMAILWPAGVGKPDSYVLWEKDRMPTTYRQNSGLDTNGDHAITKSEAVGKVRAKLNKGLGPGFVRNV